MATDRKVTHLTFHNQDTKPEKTGGDPPDGTMLNERVAKLEAILPNLATRADIEAVRSDLRGWMLATVLTIIGTSLAAIIGFATIWHPQPPAPAASQPAPYIIYAQPAAQVAPAPASTTHNR